MYLTPYLSMIRYTAILRKCTLTITGGGAITPNWASTLVNILVPKSFAVLNFTANPETVEVNEKRLL